MGTRTLLLVRHGQYATEDGGRLTETGCEQARCTARYIAGSLAGTRVDALWSSTLPRARQTATIIAGFIKGSKVRPIGVLREGMYSKVKGYEIPESERQEDRVRADSAWARLFRTSRTDRLELVVCHGNLIRYLVCRALHVSVLRWTRMNSNHCSMTRILVRGTGAVRVVTYNETAHLPQNLVT
jgi:serine/threonine-protein phosphatase PGAM5